jgi:hypothetical protein
MTEIGYLNPKKEKKAWKKGKGYDFPPQRWNQN